MFHKIGQRFIRLLARIVIHSLYWVRYKGETKLPKEGAYILCVNHRSIMDIPIAGCLSKGRWAYFMGKAELFIKPFSRFFMNLMDVFPVARGKGDIKSIRTALRYLKNGQIITIFPQGTRERKGEKLPARKGTAMLAAMSEAPIIPMCITGDIRPFRLVTAYVGKPFDLGLKKRERYERQVYEQKSKEIMDRINELPEVYGWK